MNILDAQSSLYNPKLPLWDQLTLTSFNCSHTPIANVMPRSIIERVEDSVYAPLQFGFREVRVEASVKHSFQYSSREFTNTVIWVTFSFAETHTYSSWEEADRSVRLEYQLLSRNPAAHS